MSPTYSATPHLYPDLSDQSTYFFPLPDGKWALSFLLPKAVLGASRVHVRWHVLLKSTQLWRHLDIEKIARFYDEVIQNG